MAADDIESKREILDGLKRRKHARELQAAKYGIGADPVVTIEIEDLTRDIKRLEREIQEEQQRLAAQTNARANPPGGAFDAFISYSRRDRDAVTKLVNRLRSDGFHLWVDEDQIGGGDPLRDVMVKGIQQSRCVICCLSPDYLQSKWATFESAVNQAIDPDNRRRRLIPVQIAPVAIPAEYAWLYCPDLTEPASWESEYQKTIKPLRASA
jgi:hypothetical protein